LLERRETAEDLKGGLTVAILAALFVGFVCCYVMGAIIELAAWSRERKARRAIQRRVYAEIKRLAGPEPRSRQWRQFGARAGAAYVIYVAVLIPLVSPSKWLFTFAVGVPFAIAVCFLWSQLTVKRQTSGHHDNQTG